MMSIKDVIKSSIYNSFGGGTDLSAKSILFFLIISCFLGLYIYVVYRLTSKAAFYSKDLNITIAGMPVIVTAIIIAMQSNLIVSLGMVGALSIVRFRNAIKNPLDLLYLFWTISVGIICGVGLFLLACSLCIVLTGVLLLLETVPNFKAPALLIIRSDDITVDWEQVGETIKNNTKYHKEKSRSLNGREVELIYEVRTSEVELLIKKLQQNDKLKQVNFLSHDGECRI